MKDRSDSGYINNYKNYLKQKENSPAVTTVTSTQTIPIRHHIQPLVDNRDCKICHAINKPGSLPRILNQGLYHKYTSSQDYFYSKDLGDLIKKKRKSYCIKYQDQVIYDTEEEHLKKFFKKSEIEKLMLEILGFYTKFRDHARSFHMPFFKLINLNIRKHRRLEYIRVFKQADPEESEREKAENANFNFLELLGDSFQQSETKPTLNGNQNRPNSQRRLQTDESIREIEHNFLILKAMAESNQRMTPTLSNALYNKNFTLLSRNDSETAEEQLKLMVNEYSPREKTIGTQTEYPLKKNLKKQDTYTKSTTPKYLPRKSTHESNLFTKATPGKQRTKKNLTMNIKDMMDVPIDKSDLYRKIDNFRTVGSRLSTKETHHLSHNEGTRDSANLSAYVKSPTNKVLNQEMRKSTKSSLRQLLDKGRISELENRRSPNRSLEPKTLTMVKSASQIQLNESKDVSTVTAGHRRIDSAGKALQTINERLNYFIPQPRRKVPMPSSKSVKSLHSMHLPTNIQSFVQNQVSKDKIRVNSEEKSKFQIPRCTSEEKKPGPRASAKVANSHHNPNSMNFKQLKKVLVEKAKVRYVNQQDFRAGTVLKLQKTNIDKSLTISSPQHNQTDLKIGRMSATTTNSKAEAIKFKILTPAASSSAKKVRQINPSSAIHQINKHLNVSIDNMGTKPEVSPTKEIFEIFADSSLRYSQDMMMLKSPTSEKKKLLVVKESKKIMPIRSIKSTLKQIEKENFPRSFWK